MSAALLENGRPLVGGAIGCDRTPHAIASSGGAPGPWSVLDRFDQPVLVWTEIGGTGPDLYIDTIE